MLGALVSETTTAAATIALGLALLAVGVAYWLWQQRLLNELRRLQARHRALTEKRQK